MGENRPAGVGAANNDSEYYNEFDMWMEIRAARLQEVDAIEKNIGITPTTAEIRAMWREQNRK